MACVLPISDDTDSKHFAVVLPTVEYFMLECRKHYTLHIYRSDKNVWCKKVAMMSEDSETRNYKIGLLSFKATNVVYAGSGLIGWVDLWWGILLCHVLHEKPILRFVQLPVPEQWETMHEFRLHFDFNPRIDRHLAVYNGLIKFIMLGFHMDGINSDQGWQATTWTRPIDSNVWYQDIPVDTSIISTMECSFLNALPKILDAKKLTWQEINSGGPTLSLRDDTFYITARVNSCDPAAFVLGVNTKKRILESCVQCSAEKMLVFEPNFVHCVFSSYFNMSAVSELTEEQPEAPKCEQSEEHLETLKCELMEEDPDLMLERVREQPQPEAPECKLVELTEQLGEQVETLKFGLSVATCKQEQRETLIRNWKQQRLDREWTKKQQTKKQLELLTPGWILVMSRKFKRKLKLMS